MNAANKLNAIVATYCVARDAADDAIVTLIASFKTSGIELDKATLEEPLQHAVAMHYRVEFRVKDRGEGYTWDLVAKGEKPTLAQQKSAAAKRRYHTLMSELFAGTKADKAPVKVSRKVQALMNELWALSGNHQEVMAALANAKVK